MFSLHLLKSERGERERKKDAGPIENIRNGMEQFEG